ncbi:MAG: apiosidase-like domain-containing protein [Planctomycetaceae bacterium]
MSAISVSRGPNRRQLLFGMLAGLAVMSAHADEPATLPRGPDRHTRAVRTWTLWEHPLESAVPYANAYADATLSVTYTGPGGRTLRAYGYWDGGNTFKFRCMFPEPGSWNWQTRCSDTTNTGLHNRTGSVEVSAYDGTNRLYQKGYLKVGGGKRYLTYADGSPFLWMGDTAWTATSRASQNDWQKYIDDRRDKSFSVVQIITARSLISDTSDADEKDVDGNAPFIGAGLGQWNPAYWQGLDRKIAYANDQGIIVLLVGIMEPVFRYPSAADARLFARNIAARLYGNFVILSPSFDSPYMSLGDDVGAALRDATSVHLITQHAGTSLSWPSSYYDKSYLDFSMLQSGGYDYSSGLWKVDPRIAGGQAVNWTIDLWGKYPHKPLINGEAVYDDKTDAIGMSRLPRSCGYWTWLSGAMGYTYGCSGLWDWGVSSKLGGDGLSWSQGIARPSATEMKYLVQLFSGVEWWRLEPRLDLIVENADDPSKFMVLAKSATGDFALAYLPDNSGIRISMNSFPAPMDARWFNPSNGQTTAGPARVPNRGTASFKRPAEGDWVLQLTSAK